MSIILGISAFYHDSASTLLIDGKIVAAAQEERFTRKKHDSAFPKKSIYKILNQAKINFEDIDYIVFYDKPLLKFERLLETYINCIPRGFKSFQLAMPIWLKEKLFLKSFLIKEFKKINKNFNEKNLFFSEHHLSHAASAYYPSPFKEAIILTLDGVGEWATSTVSIGRENKIIIDKEINFPHSLGLLYSAFTFYLGFRVNSGEYKVMGLAPYGTPKYKNIILKDLIDLKEDGSFRLDQTYFNYMTGLTMVNNKFCKLFGEPSRKPDVDEIKQFHMDIAASLQAATEEIVMQIIKSLAKEYSISNLCLAGGVALNCVLNGKILNSKLYKNIWVQPAAGDAGASLGAALALWHNHFKNERLVDKKDSMNGSFLGNEYSQKEIENKLINLGAKYTTLSDDQLLEVTSDLLMNGKAIGWFQGRMEFGPRALGNRSILADPRSEKMQKNLNLKIKYRESFRPFAPSILEEDLNEWFELNHSSPYMMFVDKINSNKCIKNVEEKDNISGLEKLKIKRSLIPAVTHVDYSARIQTVSKETNYKFYSLLKEFKIKTGCPILVNTSFNVRGEPIVSSPEDAFNCFMGTELDILVIGNTIMYKNLQNVSLKKDYTDKYELD